MGNDADVDEGDASGVVGVWDGATMGSGSSRWPAMPLLFDLEWWRVCGLSGLWAVMRWKIAGVATITTAFRIPTSTWVFLVSLEASVFVTLTWVS